MFKVFVKYYVSQMTGALFSPRWGRAAGDHRQGEVDGGTKGGLWQRLEGQRLQQIRQRYDLTPQISPGHQGRRVGDVLAFLCNGQQWTFFLKVNCWRIFKPTRVFKTNFDFLIIFSGPLGSWLLCYLHMKTEFRSYARGVSIEAIFISIDEQLRNKRDCYIPPCKLCFL